jgi:hypothetical protein
MRDDRGPRRKWRRGLDDGGSARCQRVSCELRAWLSGAYLPSLPGRRRQATTRTAANAANLREGDVLEGFRLSESIH